MSGATPSLRVAVISKAADVSATARLVDSGERRGFAMRCVAILSTLVVQQSDAPRERLLASGGELSFDDFDIVLPRIGSFMPELALAILRAFEANGVPTINGSAAIACSRDKQWSNDVLLAARLPIVPTIYVKDLERIGVAVEALGGPPVVIKPPCGTQGRGVILAESELSAVSIAQSLLYLNREVLLQAFVSESGGRDRRLVVVDGDVIAAVDRIPAAGEFRANYHQGAQLEACTPTHDERELACRATQALGLDVAGVDLLATADGPAVLEVNASPGFEGIEGATGLDVAAAILDACVRRASG